jgi:hypothetical protein
MFTTTIDEFKTQQAELHRQAAEYRLAKSLERPNPISRKVFNSLGRLLISSGQQLVNRYQPVH